MSRPPPSSWRPDLMLIVEIDPGSPEPPFAQLRSRITAQVASGELAPGDQLPPVRRLAEQLGIAANTVAKAYRELEADGVLEGRGRSGTFVRSTLEGGKVASAGASARAAAQRYADIARSLGLSPQEGLEVVRRALGA